VSTGGNKRRGLAPFPNGALYLSSVFEHDMSLGNPGVIDRWCRGPQRPWDSEDRHAYILNKPEQLRGPLSPYCKAGTQNREAWAYLQLVTARMSQGMRRYLCVLDIQDSCCPQFWSLSARPTWWEEGQGEVFLKMGLAPVVAAPIFPFHFMATMLSRRALKASTCLVSSEPKNSPAACSKVNIMWHP
jgi:hypothetical protein